MNSHIPLVEVTRGDIVESLHYGSGVVIQPDGEILCSFGDIYSPFFMRSSTKPFQTLAFLENGGAEEYDLTLEEIAIITSSHSGTEKHLSILARLQEKTGISEDMLQCGTHLPIDKDSAREVIEQNQSLTPNHNNCSGKHTGKLAFAKMIGAPTKDYLNPEHPVEQVILNTFAVMCGLVPSEIVIGTDGCTAPVYAVPLPAAALGYARLCQPGTLPGARGKAAEMVVKAMATHPFMIAGPNRFDTDCMTTANGTVISKIGAEGFQAVGILPGKASGTATSIGVAFKVSDGDLPDHRASGVIAMAILKALGIFSPEQIQGMDAHDQRAVTNWRGLRVGEIRPSPQLQESLEGLM